MAKTTGPFSVKFPDKIQENSLITRTPKQETLIFDLDYLVSDGMSMTKQEPILT